MKARFSLIATLLVSACGGGANKAAIDGGPTCNLDMTFPTGNDGVATPLADVGAGKARAGRVTAADLPPVPSALTVWAPGDFVLANARVAMVIEDVGASDLYDPWGGRPVGVARVAGGKLIEPADFGEILLLTGRNSVVTKSVTVLHDGSDGQAAVIRATGTLAPTPFFENIVGGLFREEYPDVTAAIDYVLAPDSDYVEIYLSYNVPRTVPSMQPFIMHGFMFTPRMPAWAPNIGFDTDGHSVPYLAFIDEGATSYAYESPGETLDPGVNVSGFMSLFGKGFDLPACAQTKRLHARITIGGPGLDGLLQAVARVQKTTQRTITGTVRDASGVAAAGVRVHATDGAGNYLTRATSAADGTYTLHVASDATGVQLTAWRRGDSVVGPTAVAGDTLDLALLPSGFVHVTAKDSLAGMPIPARVQAIPAGASVVPTVPSSFGEKPIMDGRAQVDYAITGDTTLRLPVGDWQIVVSHGYEYELTSENVTITAGGTSQVNASLEHVVDTTGVMCADFHIHTRRSNDSGDDVNQKVMSAVADGLEIPVRSDHEFVADFQPIIASLGLTDWAFGIASIEMTSMEVWGHMGVLPLEPDATKVNGGAPLWQTFPSADDPTAPLTTLEPPVVFAAVRARPEQPMIIINHPRGGANYFDYAGYDRVSGTAMYPERWDDQFDVVEVFNDSDWLYNRDRTVADWLSFLDHGRRVFAVGSSDSHGISSSPVGYPRTCLAVGTDNPHALTPQLVRDVTKAGHATISGGIYVDTRVGTAGPGDDATGVGATTNVDVKIQAASWIDVQWIELIVDGQMTDKIAVLPSDADPTNPVIRFHKPLPVDVKPGGSYVIVAVYGSQPLEPIHPNRIPFGVTNPIFLTP